MLSRFLPSYSSLFARLRGKHAVLSAAGLFLVFFAAAACHWSALDNAFVLDDHDLIGDNRFIADAANIRYIVLPRYFLSPYPIRCGARPLTVISLMADFSLWGRNSFGYHLTGILLHGINAVLVFLLARLLLRGFPPGAALAAALVFALHPVQAEAVQIASFRADLLATAFSLLSLLFFVRASVQGASLRIPQLAASGTAFAMALMSKEIAITLPVSLLLFLILFGGTRGFDTRRYIKAAVVSLAVAVCFFFFFWTDRVSYPLFEVIYLSIEGNVSPLSSVSAYVNTVLGAFLHQAGSVLFPARLSIDYQIAVSGTVLNPRSLGALALLAASLAAFLRSRDPVLRFGIGFFLISYLPVSNLIPLTNTVNDRYLYLPAVGFSLGVSALLFRAPALMRGWRSTLRISVAAGVILLFAVLTVGRNHVFNDAMSLYSDAVKKAPGNARVQYNLAIARMSAGDFATALDGFRRVAEINPLYQRKEMFFLLGNCYENLGHPDAAKRWYTSKLLTKPDNDTLAQLARILFLEEDYDAAILLMTLSVELAPHALRYNDLGIFYVVADDLEKAAFCFEKALELNPSFTLPRENLSLLNGLKDVEDLRTSAGARPRRRS